MSLDGILSPVGACKTFDANADGYARGEAINAIYIKLLDDAIRDGNPIRAVIRSTGTNSDGKGAGLMKPNPESHEALMRKVYAEADLRFSETGLVECHGTGTPTGDPLETTAVGNVFGENGVFIGSVRWTVHPASSSGQFIPQCSKNPLTTNQVKPNVGHSEGASGLTSLIKVVLALEHKVIPPNINFSEPNPNSESLSWEKMSVLSNKF
jgi:acyl transferase domain-containing protein